MSDNMESSFIPKGMVISGDIKSGGDLCVEGEVYGDVYIDGTLELRGTVKGKHIKVGRVELDGGVIESDVDCDDYICVGEGVTIIGNVTATNADIDGAISGDLTVKERVHIGGTAVIKGKVKAGEIQVEFGAVCDASIENVGQEGKAAQFFENYLKDRATNN